eukprot:TRINITY_DN72554_c0_g1_i1.p1 TRINITY_DN72554_c0_g1~~TRINITY_DN72554_c0_g1_i1.p1  ORF type:complete len:545 (+),score=143.90 TRINITY_DN72554_c0_g1_i1:69-1703(+)
MPVHKPLYKDVQIPTDVSLPDFVFRDCDKFGDKKAFIDGLTGKAVTFRELKELVRRTAAGLQALGLKKGDVVAVWSPNRVEYVVAFHAIIAAGGTVTTLNPAYTAHEVAIQLDNAGAIYMIAESSFLPRVAEAQKTYKLKEVFVFGEKAVDGCRTLASLQTDAPVTRHPLSTREDVVVIPYSSGTTGLPKGVMLTHLNIIANLCQVCSEEVLGVTSSDVLLAVLPFYHIYGMVVIMNLALSLGASCVVLPGFEPEPYMNCLKKYAVSIAHVAPPLVQFLAKSPLVEQFMPLPQLRQLFSGAAPLGAALSSEAKKRLGGKVEVTQGYGMTEMSPVSHADSIKGSTLGSIGYLVPNMECKIVDVETGKEQPVGTEKDVGELWLRGPNIMKGYHRNDQATKDCIDSDGYLHTGDIGYVDDKGRYYVVDRLKELIKAKGFQVAPAELEALLVKHPDVADAAVIGVPAEKYGGREGDGEVPKAFVVLQANAKLTQAQLSEWMAPQVTHYKRIGKSAIDFVESVPKSPSGKILRKELRELEKKLHPPSKL